MSRAAGAHREDLPGARRRCGATRTSACGAASRCGCGRAACTPSTSTRRCSTRDAEEYDRLLDSAHDQRHQVLPQPRDVRGAARPCGAGAVARAARTHARLVGRLRVGRGALHPRGRAGGDGARPPRDDCWRASASTRPTSIAASLERTRAGQFPAEHLQRDAGGARASGTSPPGRRTAPAAAGAGADRARAPPRPHARAAPRTALRPDRLPQRGDLLRPADAGAAVPDASSRRSCPAASCCSARSRRCVGPARERLKLEDPRERIYRRPA